MLKCRRLPRYIYLSTFQTTSNLLQSAYEIDPLYRELSFFILVQYAVELLKNLDTAIISGTSTACASSFNPK